MFDPEYPYHWSWNPSHVCVLLNLLLFPLNDLPYSGVGLMIHSRGANGSDAEIVWTQILQGIGGGFAAVTNQVGVQASVPHADVAMVTAIVLLITEIGSAIGSAIGGFSTHNCSISWFNHYYFSWSYMVQFDA